MFKVWEFKNSKIYPLLAEMTKFSKRNISLFSPHSRDFSFRDQIQRAAVSISSNIAEGFERQTNNEFRYFLYVAKWSCGEFQSLLILGQQLGYLEQDKFDELYNLSIETSKLIAAFIKSIK